MFISLSAVGKVTLILVHMICYLLKKCIERIYITFCYRNGVICSSVLVILKTVFREIVINKTKVHESYKHFQDCRENVQQDEYLQRPITSSATDQYVEKVKYMVMDDLRITVR